MGANSMAVSGLRGRKVLLGTGRAISIIFGINGLRKMPSTHSVHIIHIMYMYHALTMHMHHTHTLGLFTINTPAINTKPTT